MKTVGERIRQAREARKMSGDTLAKLAGYKNQSAIGNLENRPGANGGNKIGAIANALGVTIDWLLNGPDGDTVPLIVAPSASYRQNPPKAQIASEDLAQYQAEEFMQLFAQLDGPGKKEALSFMTFLVSRQDKSQAARSEGDPISSKKAA